MFRHSIYSFILCSLVAGLCSINTLFAQDTFCNVSSKTVEEALYSRVDNPSEYSAQVTTAVSFLLSNECDSALVYLRAAYKISATAILAQVINELTGKPAESEPSGSGSGSVAISEPTPAPQTASTPDPVDEPAKGTPPPAETIAASSASVSAVKKFSDEDLQAFQSKGLLKVKRLTEYFNIVSQKSTPNSTAQNTIQTAVELFDNDSRSVEVSSVTREQKTRFPIRTYLNRLRMLNYERVVIEAADFSYVSSFRKGPDGNYYGVARFRQAFTGYRDGKAVYSDITTKSVGVTLKPYQKAMEGEAVENWDVFLGDISVTQTEK